MATTTRRDRLSELGNDLIHKIMSLLSPLESARFSLISKRLSSAWFSSPEPRRNSIVRQRNLAVLTLELTAIGYDINPYLYPTRKIRPFPVALFSSRWIRSISLSGLRFFSGELLVVDSPILREFRFDFCSGAVGIRFSGAVQNVVVDQCHELKRLSFEGGGDLRELSYCGLGLNDHCHINFNAASLKSLRVLNMTHSGFVTEDWLRGKLAKLVSLETLTLKRCKGVFSVNLDDGVSKRLKNLTIAWCYNISSVNLAVSGLESLTLYGCKQCQTIEFHKCIGLKRLEMLCVEITPQMIEANLTSNRFLEDITFRDCYVSLNSASNEPSSTKSVVTCHNLQIINNFTSDDGNNTLSEDTYIRFRDFLHLFGKCNTLQIQTTYGKRYIYPKRLREILKSPLCEVKILKLKIGSLYNTSIVELVDGFLWLAPCLRVISIRSYNGNISMVKFHYAARQGVSDRTRCCSNALMTCWRHDLREVVIGIFEDNVTKENLYNYFVKNSNAKVKLADQQEMLNNYDFINH